MLTTQRIKHGRSSPMGDRMNAGVFLITADQLKI